MDPSEWPNEIIAELAELPLLKCVTFTVFSEVDIDERVAVVTRLVKLTPDLRDQSEETDVK